MLSERLFLARQSTSRRELADRSGFSQAQLVRLEGAGPLEGEDLSRLLAVLDEVERDAADGAAADAAMEEPGERIPHDQIMAEFAADVVAASIPEPEPAPEPEADPTAASAPEPAPRRRRSHRYRPRP
jgi:hypothetical protein